MIIGHETYDLFNKMVFEKIKLSSPYTKVNNMPNEACFFYVIEGASLNFSAKENMPLVSKESVLLKCGTYLSKMIYPKSSRSFEAFAVHFHPDVLKRIYSNDLPSFLQSPKNVSSDMVKVSGSILLEKYIQSFLFYFEHPELVNEELLILKLKEIILLLNQTKNAPAIQNILSSLFSPTSYTLKQIIESHLFSNISIEELAQLCNLSLSSFKREFIKLFDDSPANYIRRRKTERAAELLVLSDERISDIAAKCGFNDISHFSNTFQKKYGLSPSSYRLNQNRKSLS